MPGSTLFGPSLFSNDMSIWSTYESQAAL